MTPVTHLAGRHVVVFGLGGSGLATAEALTAGGALPVLSDDSAASLAQARARGFAVAEPETVDWRGVAALILSPGVPLTHPEPHRIVRAAKAHGVEVIGDIELFARERRAIAPGAPFIAITGTNGKSTTTALIAHLLREGGRDVALGGNIGTAILSLPPPAPGRVHVIECSSFQIDLAPTLDPSVGVLLNLSEDHLDRHGTMANYAAVKERLVARSDLAIVGVDDEFCRAIAARLPRVAAISAERPLDDGLYAEGTAIIRAMAGRREMVARLDGIGSLRGRHNAQNACAAVAAVAAMGLADDAIAAGLATFPGLAHRMEEVRRIGKVLFINDSKATNADAAGKALASFDRIHWILGGKPKSDGIDSLAPFFPRIETAWLIGAASDAFAATLDGRVRWRRCGTLDRAVAGAAAAALASGEACVVLLSPACASYDQFRNFEERGDRFRALVTALPGVT